jgi:hypothetical protein
MTSHSPAESGVSQAAVEQLLGGPARPGGARTGKLDLFAATVPPIRQLQ